MFRTAQEKLQQETIDALCEALERLLISYGYVDYCSDEEKDDDTDVIQARMALDMARSDQLR